MERRDFKKNRSDRYQNIFAETACSPEMMAEVAESQGLTGKSNLSAYNEKLMDLQDQLRDAFWRIINTQLTQRQREVLKLYADGYTQIEIAKKLKVNQSSITKSINGNCDYRNGKKIYGGAKKKLRRIAAKDSEIQSILKQIADIQDDESY